MVRKAVIVALVGAALCGMFATVTFIALEGNEVAVLRTFSADGAIHEARVWVVDDGGQPWIEAAGTDKLFYLRMLANPAVELVREGRSESYRAEPVAGAAAHDRIRELLARKYGWADLWVGMLVDTSESVAVRMVARRTPRRRVVSTADGG